MRATFMYAAGGVRVEDVPAPALQQPTDAVVRSCVCGSAPRPYHALPTSEQGTPMGHEFLGVIDDLGSEVSGLERGDLVVAPFACSDNTCDFCRKGLHTSCPNGGFWAVGGVGGAQGIARVREPTGGQGVHTVLEAVGHMPACTRTVDIVRPA